MSTAADISVIIVNYKVKEYISSLLDSIERARQNLKLQIFVVDNHSQDGSVEFLQSRYSYIHCIANTENLGFAVANNQAIAQAEGKYILIINPDTLVSEDTLTTLFRHMEAHEYCGAAGCKILNPDGTFAPESRRSVPGIWSAGTKLLGLNALFPKSKLFGRYYLSWLDEDEPSQIPVLSGSFMFWRASVLKELGGFDERFFMYGEDIDLCYRIQKTDYYIDYVPATSIIHYKGESTRKGDLRYIKLFNKALYQFFDKNYGPRYSTLFRVLIYFAVLLKTAVSFFVSRIRKFSLILTDLLILNAAFAIGFGIRFNFDAEILFRLENIPFLVVNLLISIIYVIAGGAFGLFGENKNSLSAHLKTVFIAFIGVVFITFFAREFAFSRLILVISFFIATVLMVVHRLWIANRKPTGESVSGKFLDSRIIIVGTADEVLPVVSVINSRPDWNYEVAGIVTPELETSTNERIKILGSLSQLRELVSAYEINQVFFSLASVTHKQMLQQISSLQREGTIFKLIPESQEYILGKSNVEYLETIPLVKVGLEFSKPVNRFLKKTFDLGISVPMCLLLALPAGLRAVFGQYESKTICSLTFYTGTKNIRWLNRFAAFWYITTGKMSLVGAPLQEQSEPRLSKSYKPGLTGLVQINKNRIADKESQENYELYYLQNYSIWMDIDILAKSLLNGYSLEERLAAL